MERGTGGGGGGLGGWRWGWVRINKQLELTYHIYTKIKLDYIEFDAEINFLGWGWVGVLDFLKIRPTHSNLVKLGLELSLAITYLSEIYSSITSSFWF